MSEKSKFRILLFATFGVGLFLATSPWETWVPRQTHQVLSSLLTHVLPRIGDALMIAPLLAVAVEVAAAQELLKKFALDVSHHIVGRLLPPELREHILGYLTTNFVRRRWFIEYRIEEWPKHPGFIQLRSLTEYELENRSGCTKEYPFMYQLEESYSPEVGVARICHACASLDGRPLVEHREEELKKLLKHTTPLINFCELVPIPPQPHGLYRFTAESVECLPDAFESAFVASIPVLETTVRILYPKDRMTVKLILSFAEDNVLLKTELVDGDQWAINSPMLPGQCFLTRWNRISNAKSLQVQPGAGGA